MKSQKQKKNAFMKNKKTKKQLYRSKKLATLINKIWDLDPMNGMNVGDECVRVINFDSPYEVNFGSFETGFEVAIEAKGKPVQAVFKEAMAYYLIGTEAQVLVRLNKLIQKWSKNDAHKKWMVAGYSKRSKK
jgi:hypothetical protein